MVIDLLIIYSLIYLHEAKIRFPTDYSKCFD